MCLIRAAERPSLCRRPAAPRGAGRSVAWQTNFCDRIVCFHLLTVYLCGCVCVVQVGDGEGRARDAREALRPPGLPRHRSALEPPARLLPEAQTDQQPPGPVWTRESSSEQFSKTTFPNRSIKKAEHIRTDIKNNILLFYSHNHVPLSEIIIRRWQKIKRERKKIHVN